MNEYFTNLRPHLTDRRFRKRTTIFYQGEIPKAGYIIKSGVVKVYSTSNTGEEQIVSFHTEGDILPIPWLFDQASSTLFHYETLTDCEISSFTKSSFKELLDTRPEMYKTAALYFAHTYTGLLIRIRALEQSQSLEKIIFTLYYLMLTYGKPTSGGTYDIQLNLTHATIASLTGLTRETSTVRLNQLRRKGIVTYNTHNYSINKEKIERYLGEDSFKDFS